MSLLKTFVVAALSVLAADLVQPSRAHGPGGNDVVPHTATTGGYRRILDLRVADGPGLLVVQAAQNDNDEAEIIKQFQVQLEVLRLYDGVIDGDFGPRTRAAWEAFAQAAGVPLKPAPDSVALLFNAAEVERARAVGLRDAIDGARRAGTSWTEWDQVPNRIRLDRWSRLGGQVHYRHIERGAV